MTFLIYHKDLSPKPTAQSVCVSTANEHFARKTGIDLETILVTTGDDIQTRPTIVSLSKGGSPPTSDNQIARTNCHPLLRLLSSAIVKIMIIIVPPVAMTATMVAEPSVQGPHPLPGIIVPFNSSVAREGTMIAATVDVYPHVLAAPTATLVNEGTEKRRSDLVCHHAEGHSSTDCRPTTAWTSGM